MSTDILIIMETLMMRGKAVADAARERIAAKIAAAKEREKEVTLAIVTVGEDPASHVYKNRLVKLAESLGVNVKNVELPAAATQAEVEAVIGDLNKDLMYEKIDEMNTLAKKTK